MRLSLILITLLSSLYLNGQSVLYGLAKVPGTNKIIYMSTIKPDNGYVNVISVPLATNHLGLGGGNAFDFNQGLYYYLMGGMVEANVHTGASQLHLSNLSGCYLESPQYASFDSSMYSFEYCPSGPILFGKYDMINGTFSSPQINFSTFPGEDYTYDKIGKRYFFTSNTNLYIINLLTMNVDTVILPLQPGTHFRFPQYNCNDSLIYGSYVMGSLATYLATYSIKTGVFTVLSNSPFVSGGILGGGTALDIEKNLYYYNLGTSIISVNISDGSITSIQPYLFSIPGPTHVYYIQIAQTNSCEKPLTLTASQVDFPNLRINHLVSDEIKISGCLNNSTFSLYDFTSRLVFKNNFQYELSLNADLLQKGIYVYSIESGGLHMTGKLIKVE